MTRKLNNKVKTSKKSWNLDLLQDSLKNLRPMLSRKFNVKRLGIFGSYVKGQTQKSSDIDILVEFSKRIDLLDFVALERYLSEQTGAKIDLVSLKALRPEFKDAILNEVVYI